MSLLPTVARWSTFFEKYVLSLFFLYVAAGRVPVLAGMIGQWRAGRLLLTGPVELSALLLNALTLLFGLFFGLSLLANTRAIQDPQRWRDIIIPLIATAMLYAFAGLAPLMPEAMTRNVLPPAMRGTAALIALWISLLGYAIALWSVAYLRRSLALVVAVRPLVRGGPYRYVRHPMYAGYIVLVLGLALASSSPFSLLLLVVYVGFTIYRARLEEQVLMAYSQEYRDYATRTGFLFPFVGQRR